LKKDKIEVFKGKVKNVEKKEKEKEYNFMT